MRIWVQKYPPIAIPAERFNSVTIPGMAGALTLKEGADVYESYVREIKIMPKPNANLASIMRWLTGSGPVTFGCEPDREQLARIQDVVSFEREFAQQRSAVVSFLCDPFKGQIPAESAITYDPASPVINNPGDVVAWPRLLLVGSGSVAITIGGVRQAYTGLSETMPVHIDCDTGFVYTRGSENPQNENYNEKARVTTYGDFPYFVPGSNTVTTEGTVTSLTITPNWRWL